jgi:hypothetical protein
MRLTICVFGFIFSSTERACLRFSLVRTPRAHPGRPGMAWGFMPFFGGKRETGDVAGSNNAMKKTGARVLVGETDGGALRLPAAHGGLGAAGSPEFINSSLQMQILRQLGRDPRFRRGTQSGEAKSNKLYMIHQNRVCLMCIATIT